MRMPLSAGQWICLLTFAGVTLITASIADVGIPCCYEAAPYTPDEIVLCFQQTPTKQCRSNNYVVKVKSGAWQCILCDSKWIKQQINKGKISCSETKKFEFCEE